MNKYLLVLMVSVLLLSWCWESESSNNYSSDYYQDNNSYTDSTEECIEPENPYWDWWWHDAWYNRAEENGVDSCGWNSDSFIEWCEEYLAQQEDYDSCLNQ